MVSVYRSAELCPHYYPHSGFYLLEILIDQYLDILLVDLQQERICPRRGEVRGRRRPQQLAKCLGQSQWQ